MNNNKELFETMPVGRDLTKMAIPTIITQLITMIYNLADTYFIGQTDNSYMVAGATLAFTLLFMLNALSNLFGIGGGSFISRLLGEGREEDAKKVCAMSVYGGVAVALVYTGACLLFMDPLLRLLGASDNSLIYARQYTLWVVVVGGIPTTLCMVMSGLLRSVGYSRQASLGLSGGGLLNIALDPLFMFVIMEPGNEVLGAALATMLSNTLAMIYYIIMFLRVGRKTVLNFSPARALPRKRLLLPVLAVGLPSAAGSLFACLNNTVINKLMSGYDDFAVAAMGIVKKIDVLPMNVGMGLCQAMVPLVAYNYSAENYKRMNAFTKTSRNAGLIFAAVCVVVFEIFAETLVGAFIGDSRTVLYGTDFLRLAVLATPFMCYNAQTSYTFQAMGKGGQSLFLTSCRQGLLNIPLLFVMDRLLGAYGVAGTQALADGLTLVLSIVLYARLYRSLRREETAAELA